MGMEFTINYCKSWVWISKDSWLGYRRRRAFRGLGIDP